MPVNTPPPFDRQRALAAAAAKRATASQAAAPAELQAEPQVIKRPVLKRPQRLQSGPGVADYRGGLAARRGADLAAREKATPTVTHESLAALESVAPAASFALATVPARVARTSAEAHRGCTYEEAKQYAVASVVAEISRRVPQGYQVSAIESLIGFEGDHDRPVTGSGPINIRVKVKANHQTFMERLAHKFSPFTSAEISVLVRNAETRIVDLQSNAPHRFLWRTFTQTVPLRELLTSVWTTQGTAGIVSGVASLFTGGVASAVLLTSALTLVTSSWKMRRDARNKALEATVAWADNEKLKYDNYPSLENAYEFYRAKLTEIGGKPESFMDFNRRLYLAGL